MFTEILSRNGTSLLSDKDFETEFLGFYSNLYTKDNNQRLLPTNHDWSPISSSQAADLERPFTEEEVYLAGSSLGTNKSPGPDGLIAEFFKFFWSTIKSDMICLIQNFYTSGVINVKLNEIYICLIPKSGFKISF